MVLVRRILLTVELNLWVLSSDRMELNEHRGARQISLNRDRIENINGAASPVGSSNWQATERTFFLVIG